jgi:hypothetical protein
VNPTTAEDILAGILRRDGAQTSASRPVALDASATQLRDAVLRYEDALGRAADHVLGQAQLAALDQVAEQLLTGLTAQPAYPTLAVVSRCGSSTGRTRRAYFAGPPNCMNSSRATILPPCSTGASATPRPSLARCPGSPPYPNGWATTATGAATSPIARVRDLAEEVFASAVDPAARQRLPWAEAIADAPDVALPGDLAVWRAALGIPHDDLRSTGPPQPADDAARHQYGLKRRLIRAMQPMGERGRETG